MSHEEMVKTVLDKENFLFSEEELAFFRAYSDLSCQYASDSRAVTQLTTIQIRLDIC